MAIVRNNLGRTYCGTLEARHPELREQGVTRMSDKDDPVVAALELGLAAMRGREASADGERWVEWTEPFSPDNEAVYMRVSEQTAISRAKAVAAQNGHSYSSDEDALMEFMVVHWATFCRPPGALNDE